MTCTESITINAQNEINAKVVALTVLLRRNRIEQARASKGVSLKAFIHTEIGLPGLNLPK
jgi:hypothetical protein